MISTPSPADVSTISLPEVVSESLEALTVEENAAVVPII